MGTNRRSIEGCQLVEALKLFEDHVRHSKTPPETKHSFTIPAEWILTLDPRVKQRIEIETTAEFTEKSAIEKKKLDQKLKAQMKAGKTVESERQTRLAQHDEIWKSKTMNEIAKRIEKAHLFSFNLPNYRSTLSKSQREEWDQVFKDDERRNGRSLDDRFAVLKDSLPEKAHPTLALLNVQNALEFDIARQYLMGFPVEELEKHDRLTELRKIIESGAKYPRVRLGDYLRLNTDRIKPSDLPDTRFRVLGVSNTDGVFLNETKLGEEINQAYYRVKPNEFCYNPYRVNVGSIGLCEFDYDNQIISGAYNVFGTEETELLPQYLMALFKSPRFLVYVNEKAHGGVRMNFKFEDLEEWEIPLPTTSEQERIASEFNRLIGIAKHATKVEVLWAPSLDFQTTGFTQVRLGSLISESIYGTSKLSDYSDKGIPVLRIGNIGFCGFELADLKRVSLSEKEQSKYELQKDDFLIVRSNGNPKLVGKCAVWDGKPGIYLFASYLIRFRFDRNKVNPRYVMYFLMSRSGRALLSPQQGGGTYNISASAFKRVKIPLPPIEEQDRMVEHQNKAADTIAKLHSFSMGSLREAEGIINLAFRGINE